MCLLTSRFLLTCIFIPSAGVGIAGGGGDSGGSGAKPISECMACDAANKGDQQRNFRLLLGNVWDICLPKYVSSICQQIILFNFH